MRLCPLHAGALVAIGALASACFSVEYEDGAIACGEAGCPPGFSCGSDGFCWADPPDTHDPDNPNATPRCTSVAYDPCAAIPALPADPVIDGVADCPDMLAPISTAHWLAGNASSAPSDHSAEIGVAWRPGGVYVFALVHEPELDPARNDDPVFDGDALEVYVDNDGTFSNPPSYDSLGTRQLVAAAPERSETSRRGTIYFDGQDMGTWSSQSILAVPTSDGFAIETFVRTSELGMPNLNLAAGQNIGFNLAINVSRDNYTSQRGGDYLGQYFLHVATSGSPWPFDNVEAFCAPELLAEAY